MSVMEDLEAVHLISLVEAHPVIWDRSRDDHRDRLKMRDAWWSICTQLKDDFATLSATEKKAFVRVIVKRWRNIRDQWLKWRNKHRNPLKYKPGSRAYRSRYMYHDQLQFLEKGMGNLDQAEMSHEEFFDHLAQNDNELDQQPELLLRIKSSASTESLRSSDLEEPEQPGIAPEFIAGAEYSGLGSGLADSEEFLCKRRKLSSKHFEMAGPSEDDRHMMFFRSVIPYLKSFSERQILDFQMGVLQLVKSSMEPDPLLNP